MINHIKGIIYKIKRDYVILVVNDIGYKIRVSNNCVESLPAIGKKVSILVFLYVRENILDLYGFKDKNERDSFNLLISISGIGPKLALTILSGLKFKDLKEYIIDGDVKSLTSIPGVGTKTAKRIIIELKEKFTNLDGENLGIKEESKIKPILYENVLNALVSLGYKKKQAKAACNKLIDDDEFKGNIEVVIKKALTHLMN